MKISTTERKKFRIKKKIKKVAGSDRFRLCISRSTKNISAQVIDDFNSKTLFSEAATCSRATFINHVVYLSFGSPYGEKC